MNFQSETQITFTINELIYKKLPELAKKVGNTNNKEWNVEFGNKYAKITESSLWNNQGIRTTSVWGFVVLKECTVGGIDYKTGDLLKAASYKTPAKHARGNIIDGTAKYDVWGPAYLPYGRAI